MGKTWFSAATGGFYHEGAAAAPAGAVEISPAEFAQLFAAQAQGKRIVAGDNARPVAVDRAPLTWPEQWEAIRRRRDTLLRDSDWTQTIDSPLADADRSTWATYRQALRDLPATTTDPTAIVWPVAPA